jgi:hypothetical protein
MLARAFYAPHSLRRKLPVQETRPRLRWKLFIVASTLSFLVGTGACVAAVRLLGSPTAWGAMLALLAPVACVIYASVFVYRHTARRRTLQAAATALLASLLTLAALLLGSFLTNRRAPEIVRPSPTNARRS